MRKIGLPSLKEVINQGLRPQLEDEVIRMGKIINQRFYRMEKSNLQSGSYAYKQAQIELDQHKPRYVTNKNKIAKTPLDRLYRQYMELYAKENSTTSLVSGVRRINKKRISAAVDRLTAITGTEISEDEFTEFLDAGGSELLNNKYLDSDQIIEDWQEATKNGNISTKEFLREFKRFKEKNLKYGAVKQNLERLRKRKEQRKRNRND